MLEEGALDEVAAVRDLPRDLTAMKALGVPELLAHLEGEMSLEEAVEKAQTATRQYAKRQMTWFRNQFSDWIHINLKESERIEVEVYNNIIKN